jgi:hypothetical protein
MNKSMVLALLVLPGVAAAADHNEATGVLADHIADLDDVYVWDDGAKVVVAVTFGGPGADAKSTLGALDSGVLYGVHMDTNGDYLSDRDVWVRFGQNGAGAWGVQFAGIPGGSPTVEGAVDASLSAGGSLMARAGTFDDPFFFDFQGLQDTLGTGAVSFTSGRDSFAGQNVNAFIFEMDAAEFSGPFTVWATSGRK